MLTAWDILFPLASIDELIPFSLNYVKWGSVVTLANTSWWSIPSPSLQESLEPKISSMIRAITSVWHVLFETHLQTYGGSLIGGKRFGIAVAVSIMLKRHSWIQFTKFTSCFFFSLFVFVFTSISDFKIDCCQILRKNFFICYNNIVYKLIDCMNGSIMVNECVFVFVLMLFVFETHCIETGL